jgi:hypothetical protein
MGSLPSALSPDRIAQQVFPRTHRVESCHVTIDILPDDVLLLIFQFDLLEDQETFPYLDGLRHLNGIKDLDTLEDDELSLLSWHRLVHVCQRWRSVVFASPNFLDLGLVCDPKTRVELTGIWPPLPITIRTTANWPMPEDYDFDAAMVHPNRVREIHLLHLTSSQLQRLASVMRQEFPALIHLKLGLIASHSRPAPAIPYWFLGKSAPRLQSLMLCSIPFPAIPRLLLSTTALVRLTLWDIPFWMYSNSGYFHPDDIVTSLASLTNLKSLTIGFNTPLPSSFPESRRRHPLPIRTLLPALIHFEFKGVSRYFENLLARIDAPLLNSFFITFVCELIFDLPQLAHFMERTTKFQALNEAHVDIDDHVIRVGSLPPRQTFDETSGFSISCEIPSVWPSPTTAEVLESFFTSLYIVEHLYIYGSQYFMEGSEYGLEIFYPFLSAKNLYVSKEFARAIAPTLQMFVREGGFGVVQLLRDLETLFLEEPLPSGPVQDGIGQFVAARQLLGFPIAVSDWNRS